MTVIMELSPADKTVLGSMAHGNALKIDQLGLEPEWLESEVARKAAHASIALAQLGKNVNVFNVMAHPLARGIARENWLPIMEVYNNGYGDVDPRNAVEMAHDAFITREATKISLEMATLMRSPERVPAELPALHQRMDALYTNTRVAVAKPSEVYAEDVPEVKYISRIPQQNEMYSGGWRNGMTYLLVGSPGHGKSSALRSDAAQSLILGKKVSMIVTENTTAKAFHALLRTLTGLTELEISKRKGNTSERHEILTSWVGYCDNLLRLYGMDHFTTAKIKRLLAWDKPDLLIIDYLRDVAGMIDNAKGFIKDPVGDMAYHLLDYSNHFGCAIGTAGQMSAENAKKFEAGKYMESAPSVYGTDRPRQAFDLYVGVRRAKGQANATSFFKWKDRYGGKIHTEYILPFDPKRQSLAF